MVGAIIVVVDERWFSHWWFSFGDLQIHRFWFGQMGRILNPLKESRASSAMDKDISRKSVLII